MDEFYGNQDASSRRFTERREAELEINKKLFVLEGEVKQLRANVQRDESVYADKIKKLETDVSKLETQLSGAKGVLWGGAVVVSSLFALFFDRLKEVFVK